MHIYIGSNSTGGTGYLTRIIRAAQNNRHIDIVVERGTYQKAVHDKIEMQLGMLHNVTDVHFTHTLKEA